MVETQTATGLPEFLALSLTKSILKQSDVTYIIISAFNRIENLGKGINAGYQHFLLLP